MSPNDPEMSFFVPVCFNFVLELEKSLENPYFFSIFFAPNTGASGVRCFLSFALMFLNSGFDLKY